jgi:hypothetical protein
MKILITEEQLEDVRKKLLRKIWSVRPYWDEAYILSVGIKNDWKARDKAIGWFAEFIGDEKIEKILEDNFGGYNLRVNNCGTYDFEFDIVDYTLYDENEGTDEIIHLVIEVDCKVDKKRGKVEIDGEEMSLDDALSNDEYGWEVSGEVIGCISDYIYTNFNLLKTTGIGHVEVNIVS